MRSLLVLIDGLGDDPISAWHGQTPYEYAEHPVMDYLSTTGYLGYFSICENDLVPESCSCILRLLGVGKKNIPRNRAYLELLANNRDISEFEMVLRCNLVAVDERGRLVAFNGQGLTSQEMCQAAECCDNVLKDIEFIHLSDYRNLIIMNKETSIINYSVKPPHESVGENINDLLYDIQQKSLSINYFLKETSKRLSSFTRNGIRYMLYPWSISERQGIPSFRELHGLRGGAVCKAEIVTGIAKALGMDVIVPATATGDVDTDITAKVENVLNLLKQDDFVIAHFNGSDEAAHRYDYQAKANFITRIDKQFMQVIMTSFKEPLKIIVCGDHVTSSLTGKHGEGYTPVIAGYLNTAGRNIKLSSYHDILNFLYERE